MNMTSLEVLNFRNLECRESREASNLPEPGVPEVQPEEAATPSRQSRQLSQQRMAGIISGENLNVLGSTGSSDLNSNWSTERIKRKLHRNYFLVKIHLIPSIKVFKILVIARHSAVFVVGQGKICKVCEKK